jgi:hypothetical protein
VVCLHGQKEQRSRVVADDAFPEETFRWWTGVVEANALTGVVSCLQVKCKTHTQPR